MIGFRSPVPLMFSVSLPELLLVFGALLIAIGPDKLPQAARTFGKFMAGLKRNSDALRKEFYNAVYEPLEDDIQSTKRTLTAVKQDIDSEVKAITDLETEEETRE